MRIGRGPMFYTTTRCRRTENFAADGWEPGGFDSSGLPETSHSGWTPGKAPSIEGGRS